MKMVEVFVTDVQKASHAKYLITTLRKIFPDYLINFDLEDCDRILRVESEKIDTERIIRLLISKKFRCEILH